MGTFSVYSYEIQEGNRNLLSEETKERAIDMANVIIGNLLHDGLTIIGKKNRQDQPLISLKLTEHEGVFTWILCNVKDIAKYEGHDKTMLESHPGGYVIMDNRPDVCQIAIERNNAFDSTDKVVKYLKRAFNSCLFDYGLKIIIKQKCHAHKFKELIRERIAKGDFVKKIVWDFPNPDKIKGLDATQQMKNRLEGLKILIQATNALKGKLTLSGSKTNPLSSDDEKIEDLAQIIALCAQNGYNLSYYFYNSPMVCFKSSVGASCEISSTLLLDFEQGQFSMCEDKPCFELIARLDEVRIEIADYEHEKVFDDAD